MGEKIAVQPTGMAPPQAPLSLGIVSGEFLFISGAVAFHPETGEVIGDTVQEQTLQTLRNLRTVLAARELTLQDVVQVRAYLPELRRDFEAFNAVYAEEFSDPFPARTTIGATLALEHLLVEIDIVAAL